MDRADSDLLLHSVVPTKNYDQLSLGDLLMELYKENVALDKADEAWLRQSRDLTPSRKAAKNSERKGVRGEGPGARTEAPLPSA